MFVVYRSETISERDNGLDFLPSKGGDVLSTNELKGTNQHSTSDLEIYIRHSQEPSGYFDHDLVFISDARFSIFSRNFIVSVHSK